MTIKQLKKQFNLLREQEKYTEGIRITRKWIVSHDENPQALYFLGEFLDKRALTRKDKKLKREDENEARALYKYLIKQYPKNNEGYFGLIRIYLRNKNKKAFDVAKAYLKISGDQSYNMYIGHCYREFNDLTNAEKHYLRAYPHIKNHYGPDYALATLYMQMGNVRKAQQHARRGIAQFKKMPRTYHTSRFAQEYIAELEEIVKQKTG